MPVSPRLRLSPSVSVLRRPGGALQVGLDADVQVMLPDAPPSAEDTLRAWQRPRTAAEMLRLVEADDRTWLRAHLDRLVSLGLLGVAEESTSLLVTVVGAGHLADAVTDVLEDERGLRLRHAPTGVVGPAPGVVVVAGHTVEPDRVLVAQLAAAGSPHLVVRAEPERAVVGPFVVPGHCSACVGCTDLVRRDLDRDWPYLLAQLCRAQHTPTRTQAAWASATTAAQLSAWRLGRHPDAAGVTVELDSLGRLGTRRWPVHPDCAAPG